MVGSLGQPPAASTTTQGLCSFASTSLSLRFASNGVGRAQPRVQLYDYSFLYSLNRCEQPPLGHGINSRGFVVNHPLHLMCSRFLYEQRTRAGSQRRLGRSLGAGSVNAQGQSVGSHG